MAGLLDDVKIDIACPNCGHKFKKSIRQLKAVTKFTCPKCRQGFDAAPFRQEMKGVDKSIADLQREISKLNRRLR